MKSIFCLAVLCLFANVVFGQWSQDPGENTRVTNGGLLPQLISDGSGGAYIVYQDSPALQRQLWVQWLDRNGLVRFSQNGIRVSGEARNQTPYYFLVSDSTGGVIVVFQDFQVIGKETLGAVYAQRVDSTGAKLWGEAGVEVSPPTDNKGPVSACSDGSHGVFVFWGEDADSSGVPELWGQRVSADGELIWPDNGIVITDEFTSFNVAISNPAVSDGGGGAFILYADSSGTRLNRIDAQGEFAWKNSTNPGIGGNMIEDNMGGIIIAGVRSISNSQFNILAQRVNSMGEKVWIATGVLITNLADDLTRSVEIVVNSDGSSLFFWHDKRTGNFEVFTQKLDVLGEIQWIKDGVKVSTFESSKTLFFSGIASDLSSGAVIIWSDDRGVNGGLFRPDKLYAQRIGSMGNQLWDSLDVAISIKEVRHNSYKIISNGAGGAIACWYEVGVGSGFGIFAQQLSRNGKLGEVLVTSVSEPERSVVSNQFILHQSYPNPFNAEMVLKYELPKSSFVTLTIFDITGKEVVRLINQEQGAGNYQVRWQGHNRKGGEVASGIYFYQLRAGSFVENKKAILIR